MPSSFAVKEHVVEAQHIREYPQATAHSQEDVLYLTVEYIPKNNQNPAPGDGTIIAAHANGFIKARPAYSLIPLLTKPRPRSPAPNQPPPHVHAPAADRHRPLLGRKYHQPLPPPPAPPIHRHPSSTQSSPVPIPQQLPHEKRSRPMYMSANRRDLWPSRVDAVASLRRNHF
ncbi:hypothetical protein MMYC01_200013 [Madurella mycetomatis]|uniref:Uncharacterized protein n=1 Tax=Madurella mycetomatis TaxID=100816 RepID=A0A150ASJ1_9PEZI|nr:hypothetical protein MMYC01_200013 [Madurella mycetomatis]